MEAVSLTRHDLRTPFILQYEWIYAYSSAFLFLLLTIVCVFLKVILSPAEEGAVAALEALVLGGIYLTLCSGLDELAEDRGGELIVVGDGEGAVALLVGGVDEVLRLTLTLHEGVDDLSSGTATDLEDVVGKLTLVLRGLLGEEDGDILDREVGLMAIAGVVAVVVAVHLTAARILLGADVTILPDAIGIGELTAPALSDVKHIVIHIDGEEVVDTDGTAEELYSIIRTHIGEDIGDLGTTTDSIKGERVVLHSVVTLRTAVLQLEPELSAGLSPP